MADQPIVHIGENSVEEVAFKLFRCIGSAEGKTAFNGSPKDGTDRKWILDTYAECLHTARGYRDI
ncbi:hypothetical protein [uncultured Roseibium sp.]|uniref:hypothetical protein n=1 Tax=uncultured Roseibium sp. TaxID=1936171 RepID=UPI003216D994